MIEGVLNVVDQFADIIWAGLISIGAIAGVGVAQTYRQLVMTGRMGLDTAMSAQVSRAIGAGDDALANHLALQGFTLSAGFSIFVGLSGAIFAEPLLRVLGLSEGLVDTAAFYTRIQFLSVIGLALRQMSGTALQAAGNAIIPLRATSVTRFTHLVLSPFLIFGWLGMPEMGIGGAAFADLLAQFLGAALNFRALLTGESRLHLRFSAYRLDPPVLWRTFRIGAPASVTGMERSIAQLLVVGLVAGFGSIALAAFSITRRAENLAHLGAMGIGRASGVLVGQNLGAGSPDRARKTVLWAQAIVFIMSSITAVLMFLFAESLVSIFSRDQALVPVAASWLRILTVSYVFLGAGQVFGQSFNTAGDTMAPMIVTLLSIWGVQQPLAIMLSGATYHFHLLGLVITPPMLAHLGEFGIAWAISIAMITRTALYVPYFLWGPWMRKRVI